MSASCSCWFDDTPIFYEDNKDYRWKVTYDDNCYYTDSKEIESGAEQELVGESHPHPKTLC